MEENKPMDSVMLAEFIVDALLRANLVAPDAVSKAIEIAAEEVLVWQSMGSIQFGNFALPRSS